MSPRRRRAWRAIGALVAALCVIAPACGGEEGGEPQADSEAESAPPGTMEAAEQRLAEVESGHTEVVLRSTTPEGETAEWRMAGRFQAAERDDLLPVADLTYGSNAWGELEESRFISDGKQAWVVTPEGPKQVQGPSFESLKGGEDPAGVRDLRPTAWFEGDPEARPGEPIEGSPTTVYSGKVDPMGLMDDLLPLASNLRAFAPKTLSSGAEQMLRSAVQSSDLQVVTTTGDDLIRRITLSLDMDPATEGLGDALGELAGSRIEFELRLDQVNEPIEVPQPPEGAQQSALG